MDLQTVQSAMTKYAASVGKTDIKLHPADELGNIVTLMKGIRGKWHGLNYRVPKGFESDGVSTPKLLWPVISPPVHPHTIRAGIIHDWLYRHQPKKWTREDADKLFAEICEEDGLSPLQTQLAYTGLRLFGGSAWEANADRKAAELEARKMERLSAKHQALAKAAAAQISIMQKQAGLFGNTMVGRGINDIFGHDTFVGRTFGASPEQEAVDFFRSQETPEERETRRIAAAEEDARRAAMNARIDRGLEAANRRLAAGTGVTQRRAVAQAAPKPQTPADTTDYKAMENIYANNRAAYMKQEQAKANEAEAMRQWQQGMTQMQRHGVQGANQYSANPAPKAPSRQISYEKAMAQKQNEIYGGKQTAETSQKRAPGIYNAQGQRWNGEAFV